VYNPGFGDSPEIGGGHHRALEDEPVVRRLRVVAENDAVDHDVRRQVCEFRHFGQVAEVKREVCGQDAALNHGQGCGVLILLNNVRFRIEVPLFVNSIVRRLCGITLMIATNHLIVKSAVFRLV